MFQTPDHLRAPIQKTFDKANSLAGQIQKLDSFDQADEKMAAIYCDLRMYYAELIYLWRLGVIHHEDPRWEILNKKISKHAGVNMMRAIKTVAKAMAQHRLKAEGLWVEPNEGEEAVIEATQT